MKTCCPARAAFYGNLNHKAMAGTLTHTRQHVEKGLSYSDIDAGEHLYFLSDDDRRAIKDRMLQIIRHEHAREAIRAAQTLLTADKLDIERQQALGTQTTQSLQLQSSTPEELAEIHALLGRLSGMPESDPSLSQLGSIPAAQIEHAKADDQAASPSRRPRGKRGGRKRKR